MHITIFNTPIIRTIFRGISIVLLKMLGWKLEGTFPDLPKFVIIAAPHTSNWDFLFGVLMIFAFKGKLYWMGKDTLFKKPYGFISKWLGGIPVYRNKTNNLVAETINNINNNDNMVIAISPEGTREKVVYWKTGFYYIAKGAGIPIVFGYLDYERKTAGFGPLFYPTGNVEKDMKKIREFYQNVKGKYTEKFKDKGKYAH